MSILDIFRKTDNIKIVTDLQEKITELEGKVDKSLNSDLAGIIGNSYYTLEINKDNYYQKSGAVYRGVNLLSENISSLPMKIFKGETELPIDYVFPNGFSMANPHPQMSLNELLYTTCIYYFCNGEFIQHIIVNDGIFRLQPISPKKIERNKNGSWRFDNKLTIPNEELIYSPLFNPNNDRGLSPIQVVEDEIKNDLAAVNYSTKFFENFAAVGGTLIDKNGTATHDDMKKMVNQFNLAHQSKDRAYKTLGLPQGIEYQEGSQTMREMEFLESRKDIRDRILAVLGIHKALVGVTEAVNRSVAEEAGRQMWAQTLKPAAKRLQEEYNRQLFNRYFPGYHIQFDFSEIAELQENMESLLTQAKQLREIGYSTNEINTHLNLGMENIDDPIGDMRFVPSTLLPVDEFLITPEETKTKSVDKAVDILNDIETKTRSATLYRVKYNRLQRNLEKKIASKLGNFFATQLGKVLSIIKNKKSIEKADINTLLSNIMNLLQQGKDDLGILMKPLFNDGSLTASKFALNILNIEETPKINHQAVDSGVNSIKGINNYTYKLIRTQIKESIAEGESINEMSKRIQSVYKFNKSRARIIARTESGGIIQKTTNERYVKAGVKKHAWVGGTRESHAAQDGVIVKMGRPFPNGQIHACDGTMGPGENINCRCTNYPII